MVKNRKHTYLQLLIKFVVVVVVVVAVVVVAAAAAAFFWLPPTGVSMLVDHSALTPQPIPCSAHL